jgi:hypothetical protein
LNSFEKRWLATDQLVFIAAIIVNPFFRTAPFAPHLRFNNAHIKSLLGSLYSRFFQSDAPNVFHVELHNFLMGSGQYSELVVTCTRHMYNATHEVRWLCVPSKLTGIDNPINRARIRIRSWFCKTLLSRVTLLHLSTFSQAGSYQSAQIPQRVNAYLVYLGQHLRSSGTGWAHQRWPHSQN